MRKLAIIGAGNICRQVVGLLAEDCPDSARDSAFSIAVLKRPGSSFQGPDDGLVVFSDIHDLLAWQPDLIVEAAGQEAVKQYARLCLESGRPFLVSSVGALADDSLYGALLDAARKGNTRMLIPSGAIGGLDYIRSAALFEGTRVTYESRKPPSAWKPELADQGIDSGQLAEELELFAGAADVAATRYPKNLNVAATLALAGTGMQDTQVRVVVDPKASGNQHVIRTNGPAGTFSVTIANRPSPDNPKTSWIVSRSIVSSIRRYFEPCWIG
ncbi:aspartate dehydrogenase [Pusillimonas sp. MFBS29]|uniref:aspartate dehydrogenase n=1 Tax=Pusillimonas sp. MFBS29 TaxID=2886690 RepID=UPI001D122F99|nr:aspartate dehydrogenase [Pusillimonas sp. MFBS29]MCC2597173.1 aspartate dehydrogenase [Pusillimonas sp. MFBS29]